VITTGERTLPVRTITLDGNSVQAVASGILRRRPEVLANDGTTKDLASAPSAGERSHLLKCHDVCAIKLELVDHWDGVVGFGIVDLSTLEPVERHESDSSAFLFVHDIEDLGRSLVGIDNDVEEAGESTRDRASDKLFSPGPASNLNGSLVAIRHLEQLVQRPVHPTKA
jgi:hypothetical protein